MEGAALRAASENVWVGGETDDLVRHIPGAYMAHSEADLPSKRSSHYILGPATARIECGVVPFRAALAEAAERVAGSMFVERTQRVPAFRPCVVAGVKRCFRDDSPTRFRVALDLDVAANASCAYDRLNEVPQVVAAWLSDVTDHDFSQEPYWFFLGSFADKPISAHLYFCDTCWLPAEDNRYKNHNLRFNRLNESLLAYGLEADTSITSSGLKYPFMDKWLAKEKRWRGAVLRPVLAPDDVLTWSQLFAVCDPLCVPVDRAYVNAVSFKPAIEPLNRAPTAAVDRAVTYVVDNSQPGDSVLDRIYNAVPAWRDAAFTRKRAGYGATTVFVFNSTHCPLKNDASTDQPAHVHSTAGKGYALADGMGQVSIRCQICSGRSLDIRGVELENSDAQSAIEFFNKRFALLQGSYLLEYPVLLASGTVRPYRVMKQTEFLQQEERHGRRVKIGPKKSVSWAKFWLGSDSAMRFTSGLICDPGHTADPSFYNTFHGFDSQVVAAASAISADLSQDDLLQRVPYWWGNLYHNLCAEDMQLATYVLQWLALMIQQPGTKPRVALVITGPPGCGKGQFARMLMNIVGKPHALQVRCSELTERFNYSISEAVLLFVDEAADNKDRESHGALKQLITEPDTLVKRKYHDGAPRKTFQHVIFASNDTGAVPYQAGERRFAVLGAKYGLHQPGTDALFEWNQELDTEVHDVAAQGALLLYLSRVNLQDFRVDLVPRTRAMWATQYESMMPVERFVYRLLCTGHLMTHDWSITDANLLRKVEILISMQYQRCTDAEKRTFPRDLGQLPYNVFADSRADALLPKALVYDSFHHQFPNTKMQSCSFWTTLYERYGGREAWPVKHLSLDGMRLMAVTLPNREDLEQWFLGHRGNVDSRIFHEWRID